MINKSLIFLIVFFSALLQAQDTGFDSNGSSGWGNGSPGDRLGWYGVRKFEDRWVGQNSL